MEQKCPTVCKFSTVKIEQYKYLSEGSPLPRLFIELWDRRPVANQTPIHPGQEHVTARQFVKDPWGWGGGAASWKKVLAG